MFVSAWIRKPCILKMKSDFANNSSDYFSEHCVFNVLCQLRIDRDHKMIVKKNPKYSYDVPKWHLKYFYPFQHFFSIGKFECKKSLNSEGVSNDKLREQAPCLPEIAHLLKFQKLGNVAYQGKTLATLHTREKTLARCIPQKKLGNVAQQKNVIFFCYDISKLINDVIIK